MNSLYKKLLEYSNTDYYPMHMPGHKRNSELMDMINPYNIDITEIEGFDNLHQAEGIINELSERISKLYGADRSFLLVNGSTAGILAGISAATGKEEEIIIARNSHKSVYHGTILRELQPIYIYPQQVQKLPIHGGILPEDLERLLIAHPNCKLVVITSPTYEGVVSDIKRLAETTHRYGAMLLVDEAHGAHFGFHKSFPKSAITLGADIVIQSIHKTLPAFTQSAVLHSNRPELNHRIAQYLAMYQSSSPSYLLMAGLDCCINLLEEKAEPLFETYHNRLSYFYQSMKELKHLMLLSGDLIGSNGIYDMDPSKITISTLDTGLSGHQLSQILREKYHVVMEMDAKDYVLGMTSICDTKEGFDRLEKALLEIDGKLGDNQWNSTRTTLEVSYNINQELIKILFPYQAKEQQTEQIPLRESGGRISATFISLFPPGSPLLVPGEILDENMIQYIDQMIRSGIIVTGLSGESKDKIEVIITAG